MLKIISLLFFLCSFLLGSTINLTEREKLFLNSKKIIHICIDPNYMPFERVTKEGTHEGIFAEYYKLFSQKIGVAFKVVPTKSYKQSWEFFESGKCDIISGDVDPGFTPLFDASTPYMLAPSAFAIAEDAPFVEDFSEIKEKPIGVIEAISSASMIQKIYPGINLIAVKSVEDGLKKVATGEIYSYIGTFPTLAYVIQELGLKNVKIGGAIPTTVPFSALIHKRIAPLTPILNKAIDSITTEEHNAITSKWIKTKVEKGFDYILFAKVLAVVAVVLLIILYWNYKLRSFNEKLEDANIKIQKALEGEKQKKEELALTLEELKTTQSKLIESEKMASMGILVAGVAHEVNTPVGTAYTASTSIDKFFKKISKEYENQDLPADVFKKLQTKTAKGLDLITFNLHRTNELITSFKRVSVDQHVDVLKEIDLLNYITDIVNSISHEYKGKGHQLILPESTNITLRTYPGAIAQIITNLVINSVTHAFASTENGLMEIQLEQKEKEIVIIYSDNGSGMNEETLEKIFDPFFTTNRQTGTGLGLNIVYNLITQKLSGSIEVESEKDNGSRFIISLPLM